MHKQVYMSSRRETKYVGSEKHHILKPKSEKEGRFLTLKKIGGLSIVCVCVRVCESVFVSVCACVCV